MNQNSKNLLNAILRKDEEGVRQSFKSAAMGVVEGVREVAAEEMWSSTMPLPEAADTIEGELKAIEKARTLPDVEVEEAVEENVFVGLNQAIQEDREAVIEFEDGESYTLSPEAASKLLSAVTEEELEEAAESYEAFAELVHNVLDEEEGESEDCDEEEEEEEEEEEHKEIKTLAKKVKKLEKEEKNG